ncbi:MAG: twin-arginine translocase subunit TatC [Deltaproteobacteria bacterium]|nr:twin-arginine translocase subunit TatC [Deltaproteobacteria bacterium]
MFGIGTSEAFLLLVLILVLGGPERLPATLRWAGRQARAIRGAMEALQDAILEGEATRRWADYATGDDGSAPGEAEVGPRRPSRASEQGHALLGRLAELRRRLLVSAAAVGIGVGVCFVAAPRIWAFLAAPLWDAVGADGTIAVTRPTEGVTTWMGLSLYAGLVVASPVLFLQAWGFAAPRLGGLRRAVLGLGLVSTVLFLAGAAFGYLVMFRQVFPFLIAITHQAARPVISMAAYLDTAAWMLLLFGLCFELPVVVWVLARLGWVTPRRMVRGFRYAVVGIFVVAAVVTPPDVVSQAVMALPLLVLYGVSIGVSALARPAPPKGLAG